MTTSKNKKPKTNKHTFSPSLFLKKSNLPIAHYLPCYSPFWFFFFSFFFFPFFVAAHKSVCGCVNCSLGWPLFTLFVFVFVFFFFFSYCCKDFFLFFYRSLIVLGFIVEYSVLYSLRSSSQYFSFLWKLVYFLVY